MTKGHGLGGAIAENSVWWRLYRTAWSGSFGFLVLVGLLGAITALPLGTWVGLALAISVPTAASVAAWSMVSLVPRHLPGLTGMWAAVLVLTAYGLVTIFGPWSLIWLLLVSLGSPTALRVALLLAPSRRRALAVPSPTREAPDLSFDDPHTLRLLDPGCPVARRPILSTLSRGDLSGVWRMSGSWLAQGLNVEETAHLVRLRESCLDEMERRDPFSFQTWFPVAHPADTEAYGAAAGDDSDPPPQSPGAT
ncbi:MAG: hypothetical protein ABIU87_01820 [Ornithinibacter sp.]